MIGKRYLASAILFLGHALEQACVLGDAPCTATIVKARGDKALGNTLWAIHDAIAFNNALAMMTDDHLALGRGIYLLLQVGVLERLRRRLA